MNRGYLALGAAAVLAAVVGLYAVLATDDVGAADRTAGRSTPTAEPGAVQKIVETPGKPRLPSTEPTGSASSVGSAGAVTEYYVGTTRVRDHRAGEHTPRELSPSSPPPRREQRRETAPQLSADLAKQIRPLFAECTASVPSEVRGNDARVEGEIIVAIKDHQARVTSASLALRDVPEATQVEVRRCFARGAVGLVASAGNEEDVDSYPITLSLSLR